MPSKRAKLLRSIESRVLGTVLKNILIYLPDFLKNKNKFLPYWFRVAVSELVPTHPLKSSSKLEAIEVVIPCINKDRNLLGLCIEGAKRNLINPIGQIRVIGDEELEIPTSLDLNSFTLQRDYNLIPKKTLEDIDELIPSDRKGWVIKQILAMYLAYSSDYPGILVLDADTILLKQRLLLMSNKQVIFPVVEFNLSDSQTTSSTWVNAKSLPVSFTSHHILLQPKLVREMFDSIGGFEKGARKWLISTQLGDSWLPLSDMHTYGTWMLRNYPSLVYLAKWRNLRISRTILATLGNANDNVSTLNALITTFPSYMSVSFHHYLKDDFVGQE